jgi:hypothetical protein
MSKVLIISLLLVVGGFTSGCPSQCLVRDPITYRIEMDFMEQAALQPASALALFVSEHCKCTEGKFIIDQCRAAADMILTIQTRIPWHKAMSLYLGGLEKVRPEKDPPAIPAPETLCPND